MRSISVPPFFPFFPLFDLSTLLPSILPFLLPSSLSYLISYFLPSFLPSYAPYLLLFAFNLSPLYLASFQDHVKSGSPILAGYSSHSLHSNGNIVLTDGAMADMEASSTLMVRQYVENMVRTSSPSPSRPMRYVISFALM